MLCFEDLKAFMLVGLVSMFITSIIDIQHFFSFFGKEIERNSGEKI
jgi:hypothetical protein